MTKEIIVSSPYEDILIPDIPISDFIWSNHHWPNLPALSCGITNRTLTFRQLHDRSFSFGSALLHLGLKKGDVVITVLPNTIEHALAILGICEAGLTLSCINPLYTPYEILFQVKDCRPKCIITSPEVLGNVQSALKSFNENSFRDEIKVILTSTIEGQDVVPPPGVYLFSDLIKFGGYNPTFPSKTNSEETVFLFYSSGTTGLPKGVCISSKNFMSALVSGSTNQMIPPTSDELQAVALTLPPFFHIFGTFCLFLGCYFKRHLVIIPRFSGSTLISTIRTFKPNILALVPHVLMFMVTCEEITAQDLSSVWGVSCGAAPLGKEDVKNISKKFTTIERIQQGYGMTECSPLICKPGPDTKPGSVGPLVPNTQMKVVNPETGESLGPGQQGELWVRGPQVMKGYLNNPDATKEVLVDGGWLRTGDIGYYDEDKSFYICDRLKDLIKVKGYQVAPAELEEVLRSHPLVHDAGVIGVPCKRSGEVPVAFVQLKTDAPSNISDELKTFVAKRVVSYKKLNSVHIVNSLPRSMAGKILRKELRAEYLNSLQSKI